MKTTEDQLRAIIDTIPALAWSAHPDGSAEFFNQRWLDYAGLSIEEARDWGWTAAVHADDLNRLGDYWRSMLLSGEPGEIEARLRRFDGVYRWFLFRANPFRDESGNIVKWYGTNADIEDRKRAEDALRASERRSRLIVDSIPGLVCTMSASGEVELLNRQVLEYFGKTAEELRNWATSDAVHPDDLPRVLAAWTRSLETGDPYDIEHRIRRADGVYRWFQTRALPVRDTDDWILGWYVLLTDIDERKRAEEKLRRSEWNLLEAQRLGHSGSWSIDIASGTVTASPEMIRSVGFKPNEDYSRNDSYFNKMHPEDQKRVLELFERCVNERIDFEAHYRMLGDGGAIKYMHSIGYPVLNETGDLVEFVGAVIETTEQMQARIALENALTEVKLLRDQLYKENLEPVLNFG